MKILVISDSHGRRSALESVAAFCRKPGSADLVIHLGDHISDTRYLRERISQRILAVPGNCDWSDEPAEKIENLGGVNVLICHGHTLRVKTTLFPLTCRAQEAGVQAALFGHTHAPFMGYEYGVLLLNPGALKDEKCALMTIEQGEIRADLRKVDELC